MLNEQNKQQHDVIGALVGASQKERLMMPRWRFTNLVVHMEDTPVT